jgi:hypothetical protein
VFEIRDELRLGAPKDGEQLVTAREVAGDARVIGCDACELARPPLLAPAVIRLHGGERRGNDGAKQHRRERGDAGPAADGQHDQDAGEGSRCCQG